MTNPYASLTSKNSSSEHAGTASLLDSLLGSLREKLGLDDNWDLGHGTLSEDLEESLY